MSFSFNLILEGTPSTTQPIAGP
ncbi:uncharacterized protein METZ01_LOCUS141505 [marine metagenome]|uniref:Uncharacterized protein n=1 Tax=marine metagenome TaxID=408172 RepID=A0A381ZI35_9ZZZZ